MKAHRHVYLDFPNFTQESRYEITSKVTFQNGVEDEIKTTVVCDDPYDAMEMVRDFLLSKRDWLVTEVHGQWFEEGAVLVVKPEIRDRNTRSFAIIQNVYFTGLEVTRNSNIIRLFIPFPIIQPFTTGRLIRKKQQMNVVRS